MANTTRLQYWKTITLSLASQTTSILTNFSPESGKGIDIAHGIYKRVCGTELENRLSLVKADGSKCEYWPIEMVQ
ncbi:hypothetical protein Anas_12711 [Armadillidium nasatum]|uniref:Uncharacterized protein n=1 Tax=Armadillidium nasatum TaxID=96803 RepID=A0A5N5T9Y6_9CRUS|nr:hypothetical protein Anas_12711 [Armadillidium nasatum]